MGPSQLVFLVSKTNFLEENEEQLMDFFEDHVRGRPLVH